MDGSARSRIALFHAQVRMLSDYPLGLGFRTTSYLSNLYIDPEVLPRPKDGDPINPNSGRSSHNTFASIPVDQGIPGLLLMICGIFSISLTAARLLLKKRSTTPPIYRLYTACIAGSLATIFVSAFFVNFIKGEVWVWLVTMLLVINNLVTRQETTTKPVVP
jgi:O-antigen ligase